jgi:hypothetical protein
MGGHIRVPAAIAAQAREREFGTLQSVHRRRRGQEAQGIWALWILLVWFIAVVVMIGIVAGLHWLATALVIATIAAVIAFRYGVKPHVVALYEHGMVDAQDKQVKACRWEDIPYVWREPGQLTLWFVDREGRVVLTGLSRWAEMAATVDAEVQPRVLARAERQVAETGQATFPPLTITAKTVVAVIKENERQQATWERIDSYVRTDGSIRIDISAAKTGIPGRWISRFVANAIAAERLMDQIDPTTPQADVKSMVAQDVATGLTQARKRGRRARRLVALQDIPMAAVLVALIPLANISTTSGYGYQVVCDGTGSTAATSYNEGRAGPHPIDFEGDKGFGNANLNLHDANGRLDGINDTLIEPASWVPANRGAVELVACVTTSPTSNPDEPLFRQALLGTFPLARSHRIRNVGANPVRN